MDIQEMTKNARYIVFCIDEQHKDHAGKIFASYREAKQYAVDSLKMPWDPKKAVVGLFVWDGTSEIDISLIETIGFKKDVKRIEQLDLFK